MTFQELIEKKNGKYVEVAGSADAKNQCVDLANLYIRDVLGFPIIEWTNAVDFPQKTGDNYEYILNTPTNIPKEGDLIVWKPSPGHIAIFIEGNVDRFMSFDQNFPVGSPCHAQEHTYQNVIGWLRPKTVLSSPELVACQKQVEKEIKNKDETYAELQGIKTELNNKDEQVSRLKDQLLSEQKLYSELQERLNNIAREQKAMDVSYQSRITELQNQVNEKAKEIGRLNTLLSEQAILVQQLQDKALDGVKWYKIGKYKIYIRG